MGVLHPRCADLDVHRETVVAYVRHMANGTVNREVRTFKTTCWPCRNGWPARGSRTWRWRRPESISETGLAHSERRRLYPGVGQCRHVKNVPGRKAGVNDATWLADLMAHGLIRGSFVPDAPTQELRGLLRTRKQFVRERSSHIQRLQKTLEDANIKLDSVISDILGLSGRAMVEALIAGESDPDVY